MSPKDLRRLINELPPVTGYTFWDDVRRDVRNKCTVDNPYRFLHWPIIAQTINIGPRPDYLSLEYQSILNTKFDGAIEEFRELCAKKDLFNEYLTNGKREEFIETITTNLIHQACHLNKWEQVTGMEIEKVSNVIEVGCGFGAMRLLVWLLNPHCEYVMVDVPEMQLLQQFFLKWAKPDQFENTWFNDTSIVLEHDYDVLMSFWGVSEVQSFAERNELLDVNFKSCIFAYQGQWTLDNGVDNEDYFNQFKASLCMAMQWSSSPISHLGGDSKYLVGWK